MRAMDLLYTPLQGLNLIEASAGTGKTYTLTGLYLRLLIEQELSPHQILVVTYTNAATAELKERIRHRLLLARQAFGGQKIDDALIEHLIENQPSPDQALKRLDLAIAGFDQAAIYTIHGFCQRVLIEHAFEGGQPMDVELAPDQEALHMQIAEDFWRTQLACLPDGLTDRVQAQIGSPERLLASVRQGLGKPYLEVRGPVCQDDLQALDQQAARLVCDIRRLWAEEGEAVSEYLKDEACFKQTTYKSAKVQRWCEEMTQWLAQGSAEPGAFANLRKFTRDSVRAGLRKGKQLQEFTLFSSCQSLAAIDVSRAREYTAAIGRLREQFFQYLETELRKRQIEAGEWSYDDLLLQLDQALSAPQGRHLAQLLQQRFRAAMVDEFQDTDPVQYRIFTRIYAERRQPVFLVGDPKQAIYSFRGADIFAYLQARASVDDNYGLDVNWRSSAELIRGINTLFDQDADVFFYPQIPFNPVRAAKHQGPGLVEKGDRKGPLRIWQLAFDPQARLPEIRQAVAEGTAAEIARLLKSAQAGRVSIDGKPLGGGDIAVLVRKHAQAKQIAEALLAHGVHSVRTSMANVFRTPQAQELERVLLALLEPRQESRVHAALATDLLGWSGREIDAMSHDPGLSNRQLEAFIGFHQQWREQGFVRMFRRLLFERDIETRLLDFRDGERRLTNLYQLIELLHRQDVRVQPGMEGLLKWFSRQRQDPSADEELQLRLESDSHLVKIVTQHSSKGLQYPLVFCPFLWDETLGLRKGQSAYLFHDPEADYQAVFELGSEAFKQNSRYFMEEELAENLRLLYVALTRAQYRCYLPWGKVKNSENSALGWLLHPPQPYGSDKELCGAGTHKCRERQDAPSGPRGHDAQERPPSRDTVPSLESWQSAFKKLTADDIQQRLELLAERAAGAISLDPLPGSSDGAQLPLALPPDLEPARRLRTQVVAGVRVSSFSSLVSGQAADLPDHDLSLVEVEEKASIEPALTIHGFPRGPGPGTCLHAIFEEWDFTTDSRPQLQQLVEQKLLLHQIEARWTPVVADMMASVLTTPLNPQGLTLETIGRHQRINEMEFHYPIGGLEARALSSLVRRHGFAASQPVLSALSHLSFARIEGFMKGFIDLVFESGERFYLADYKSNWLGEGISAYAQEHLEEAMLAHHYHLQYLFYCLALHRYLQQRLTGYDYERHFGGVFYLFLRGMQLQAGCDFGVYRERPPKSFILALDALIGEGL